MKLNQRETTKPKRISDKQMRELLLSLKKEAENTPDEEGSFSVEVICSGKDIAKSSTTFKPKK
ncbi:hypothetical protein [endosymbiont GvMRE of Glomus versiforme]|uniref:hypothetical protein n=1 Tax=endosymbiont GvMRE of Glomus versiforme TaxID=2039283 RepID=UPI000EC6C97E|nr:hypothetical protein [endosymbiont GvMRE of Glomus versiforme]RHZ35842.1 hypothetical protein GvMRE_Ic4g63 [endosymbiont GvMRE of Glomus versiforme]RHZ35863.1 hypothetical protein GvMRE_Ic4g101 [endosymbiont GvMRE of Glomus versiforme]